MKIILIFLISLLAVVQFSKSQVLINTLERKFKGHIIDIQKKQGKYYVLGINSIKTLDSQLNMIESKKVNLYIFFIFVVFFEKKFFL